MNYDPILNLSVGLGILIPLAGYYSTLWYLRWRRIERLLNTGRLVFSPNAHNYHSVVVGSQYAYLDSDSFEEYFWVDKIDRGLGLIRVSFYRTDGKWIHSPLPSRRWTHEIPKNQGVRPEDLARTRLGALFAWIGAHQQGMDGERGSI